MHPYIPHLLSDIEAAHRTEKIKQRASSFEEILDQVNELKNANTFGYYCGLEAQNFPPEEQLLVKDVKLVNSAFKKMMKTWSVGCYLPKKVPAKMVYRLLIQTLERNFDPLMQGTVTWTYCRMNSEKCVLKEYCSCVVPPTTEGSLQGKFMRL